MQITLNTKTLSMIFGVSLIITALIFGGFISKHILAQSKISLKKTFKDYQKSTFSPDGAKLALMSRDNFKIVNLSSGKEICKIPENPSLVFYSLSFSPNGKYLAAKYATDFGITNPNNFKLKVTLWNTATCAEVRTLSDTKPTHTRLDIISFSNDGKLLATNVNGSRIWEVETGREIYHSDYAGEALGTLLSPDGKWLLTYSEKTSHDAQVFGTLHILNLATKEEIEQKKILTGEWTFSSDSSKLIIGNFLNRNEAQDKMKQVIEIINVGNWTTQFTIDPQKFASLSLSRDKKMLAVGGFEKFSVYSTETGEILTEGIHRKRGFLDDIKDVSSIYFEITDIKFSPDGTMLSTGGEDGTVKLWDLKMTNN